ncbi:MAG: ATP-binding protein, partial [Gemmatimonadaceae bacterium]
IEVSYLLQKMEQFSGIAILATNLRANLDAAFIRRLAFLVHFPLPDQASRERIWRSVWPDSVPMEADVDFTLLSARFPLSGGNIRNMALAAAFSAAHHGGKVGMTDLVAAARREYQKIGKELTAADLGPLAER